MFSRDAVKHDGTLSRERTGVGECYRASRASTSVRGAADRPDSATESGGISSSEAVSLSAQKREAANSADAPTQDP